MLLGEQQSLLLPACGGDQRVSSDHELSFTPGFALGSLGCSLGEGFALFGVKD